MHLDEMQDERLDEILRSTGARGDEHAVDALEQIGGQLGDIIDEDGIGACGMSDLGQPQ